MSSVLDRVMLQSAKVRFLILSKVGKVVAAIAIGFLWISISINLISYRNGLVKPVRVFPSAEVIGNQYLQAVIQKNRDYLKENACIQNQLFQDIARFGGAEVQNIVVHAEWNSGNSDAEFEVTSIKFQYRSANNISWQTGEIRLLTATNLERNQTLWDVLPFRRIHCAEPGI